MNQKGMTLVEIMISVLIAGVVVGAMTGLAGYSSNTIKRNLLLDARTRIINSLNIIGNASTIRASAFSHPENVVLENCVRQNPAPCEHLGTYKPMRTYYPSIDRIAQYEIVTSSPIAGTPTQPLRYDSHGRICDTVVSTCPAADWPIEVFTEFVGVCPPSYYTDAYAPGTTFYGAISPNGLLPQASCRYAMAVHVRLTVRNSVDPGYTPPIQFPNYVKTFTVDVGRVLLRIIP